MIVVMPRKFQPTCKDCGCPRNLDTTSTSNRGKLNIRCRTCCAKKERDRYLKNNPSSLRQRKDQVRICRICGGRESEVEFYKNTRKARCKVCSRATAKQNRKPVSIHVVIRKQLAMKVARKDFANAAKFIVKDSRMADKRSGMVCDLTVEFVSKAISQPCSYCGTTKVRMSLDRIDNKLGHSMANVKPCCRRCNWLRRDMPYQAWLLLVPALMEVERNNLWADWHAGPKSHSFLLP